MAGRNYTDPRVLRSQNARAHSVALMEERIAGQHREIQTLLLDNQQLAATYVALKQDFDASQQELRHLSAAASTVKIESDAQVREVYEKARKLEAEAASIDCCVGELNQVRADIQELTAERKELTAKLAAIDDNLARGRSELQQFPVIKAEIETLHKEIQRGRAAIEYEKKMYATNMENSRIMDQHMISMSREIDKLKEELGNAEKRARAAATVTAAAAATPNPGYPAGYVMPDHGYGGHFHPAPYAMPQMHDGVATSNQYGHMLMPPDGHNPHEFQRSNVR